MTIHARERAHAIPPRSRRQRTRSSGELAAIMPKSRRRLWYASGRPRATARSRTPATPSHHLLERPSHHTTSSRIAAKLERDPPGERIEPVHRDQHRRRRREPQIASADVSELMEQHERPFARRQLAKQFSRDQDRRAKQTMNFRHAQRVSNVQPYASTDPHLAPTTQQDRVEAGSSSSVVSARQRRSDRYRPDRERTDDGHSEHPRGEHEDRDRSAARTRERWSIRASR